ncbi:MAG TPA: hypothetical protein VLW86_06065 [Syntrophorhabdales bacterium]|nr:hypothetical protein [Syntrophorhabdales bacterium]
MKSSNKWGWNIRTVIRTVTILVLAVLVAGPVFTPAFGDDRDHRDRGHHGDRDRHRGPERHGRYYWHGEYYDSPPPGYYAPPPPQVYAPPPPPPGITFVFPLHF